MSIAVAQQISNTDDTSTTTMALAFAGAVTAGSTLVAVTYSNGSNITGVSDSVNGAWAAKKTECLLAGRALSLWVLPNTGAGTPTVTATWAASQTTKSSWIFEISGTAAASYQASNSLAQFTPGTATDAITSGSMTPSSQPALVLGVCKSFSGGTAPVAGTGYTTLGNGTGTAWTGAPSEWQRITSTSALAATFTTSNASGNYLTAGVVLTETTGGVTVRNANFFGMGV